MYSFDSDPRSKPTAKTPFNAVYINCLRTLVETVGENMSGRFLKDGNGALTEGGPGLSMFATIFLLAFASLTVILSLLSGYFCMKRKCCRRKEDDETDGEKNEKDVEEREKPTKRVKKVADIVYIENTLQFASSFVKMCLDKKSSLAARRTSLDYGDREGRDEEQPTSTRSSMQEHPDPSKKNEPTAAEF